MKILFINGAYPQKSEDVLRACCKNGSGFQNSANLFQSAVIEGLYLNQIDFEVVSFPFLPSFPKQLKVLYTPQTSFELHGEKIGEMRSYCTLFGFKYYSIKRRVRAYVEDWVRNQDSSERLVLLTYTPYLPFLNAIIPLKKKYKNIVICSIITDLIMDYSGPDSPEKSTFSLGSLKEKLIVKSLLKIYPQIDKFVLLTKTMEEVIPAAKGNSIIIEGIAPNLEKDYIPKSKKSDFRTILYAGTLLPYSGILELLKAFSMTKNKNYRLIICGGGGVVNYIKEYAKKDSRIIYKGLLPHKEIVNLQKEATLLINPRKPTELITRYSFPSKTMEMLSSGTPMLGYRLEGIPKEYYDYYFTPSDLSVESLSEKIDEIFSAPQDILNSKAEKAYCFIKKNKTSVCQIRKLIDFLVESH